MAVDLSDVVIWAELSPVSPANDGDLPGAISIAMQSDLGRSTWRSIALGIRCACPAHVNAIGSNDPATRFERPSGDR